ncbi:hypothetical protein Cgig2_028953 [Carnegiea gigantea]|uniref:Uncharacterized protein n=1 Tax=Carnegiea gigantea TaxID=171969 RepID=A0A9Q1JVM1_9CARY|nr:hypothetical protein Cgig2_028953 [Carnegiea gigantea]
MEAVRISNKIRDIVRLHQLLKKWRKQAKASKANNNGGTNNNNNKGINKFLKKTLSFSENSVVHSVSSVLSNSDYVPKGYLAVCVGREEDEKKSCADDTRDCGFSRSGFSSVERGTMCSVNNNNNNNNNTDNRRRRSGGGGGGGGGGGSSSTKRMQRLFFGAYIQRLASANIMETCNSYVNKRAVAFAGYARKACKGTSAIVRYIHFIIEFDIHVCGSRPSRAQMLDSGPAGAQHTSFACMGHFSDLSSSFSSPCIICSKWSSQESGVKRRLINVSATVCQ